MKFSGLRLTPSGLPSIAALAGILLLVLRPLHAEQPKAPEPGAAAGTLIGAPLLGEDKGSATPVCAPGALGSPYIPVDSWVYPAVLRLYSLGFVDNIFLGMRPYTRSSLGHMLEEAGARIADADGDPATEEAESIYDALTRELRVDSEGPCGKLKGLSRVESVYSASRAMSGTPLRDSFHLGQTITNDYGRPYENGFNNYSGASGYASAGRFTLYARGEFQRAPSATGYSATLAEELSLLDNIEFIDKATGLPYNQATIPLGPIASATNGRLLEAYASANFLNHVISFGKQDDWLGPGLGGGMAYSNNAENIYSFRINRVEPLHVPGLSRFTGPFRYEFLVGSLKGHVAPNDPWVHVEKISLRPTKNLEFGFERTVIWGGKDHEPITLHTFLRSFFSAVNVTSAIKNSAADPGARFGAFDFSYRLPFVRKWLTLYTDSEAHDDVSPADAPRRAAYRPGIYLSHVPGLPKLDLRVEGASSDTTNTNGAQIDGRFMYWESIQKQGYTNNGQLFGDWIGREAKGGQGWLTWHLSGNEWIQAGARNQKVVNSFIPGGTTLNDFTFQAVKRIGKEFEINGNFVYEKWTAPIYGPGTQTVTSTTIQLTWLPKRKTSF
jgi:hypothetical protein